MDQGLRTVSVPNGREIAEILRALGRIEAGLEAIKATQTAHDQRISWLESKANWALGAIAVMTFAISAGLEFMKGLFRQ